MPRTVVSMLVIFALLLFGFILFALRGCESASNDPQESTQYPATLEETTSSESAQHSNDLPPTGGVRLW